MSTPILAEAAAPATFTAMRPLILPSRGALSGGARKPSGGQRVGGGGNDAMRRPSKDRCNPSTRKGGRRSTSAQARRRIVSPATSELTASSFLLSYVKSSRSPAPDDNSAESSTDEMAPNAPAVLRSRRSKRDSAVNRRARSETFSFPKPPKVLPSDAKAGLHGGGLGIENVGLSPFVQDAKPPIVELPEGFDGLLEAARADEKLMAELEHGLTGSQGWSPNTPEITAFPDPDEAERDGSDDDDAEIEAATAIEPLTATESARPLRVSKRPTSAGSTGSAPSDGAESWAFSTSSGSVGGSPRKRAVAPRLNSLPPAYTGDLHRRSVSAPALNPPAYTPGWEEEPDEYPFPLMQGSDRRGSADSNASSSSVEDEDAIKLARLNASLSLLGSGSVSSLQGPQPAPTTSRFQLQYTLGLEEQMAFACGAGSDFEWASSDEAEGRRASAASEYLPKRRNAAKREAMVLPRLESSPLRLSLDKDAPTTAAKVEDEDRFGQGHVAVIGSSWSECGGDLLSRANSLAGNGGRRGSVAMLHRADSTASSSCLSANWSPIMTERLSAESLARAYEADGERFQLYDRPMSLVAVDELFGGPLPQLTPVPAGPSTPDLVKDSGSDDDSASASSSPSSPSLLCDPEFSYLMTDGLVLDAPEAKAPSTLQAKRLPSQRPPMATEPCRIFTPALTTPELEKSLNATDPMDSLPSPLMAPTQQRLTMTSSVSMPALDRSSFGDGPIITITPPSEASMSRQASSIATSASTSSVLCRPRPVTRGGAFFGNAAADAERSVSASLPRTPRRPTTAGASPLTSSKSEADVRIPQRKSSLELGRGTSPTMPRSPSSSSGPIRVLSPEALARLRQARDREVQKMRAQGKQVRSVRFSCDVDEVKRPAGGPRQQQGMTRSASALPILVNACSSTARSSPRDLVSPPRMVARKPVPSIGSAPIPTALRPAVGILSSPLAKAPVAGGASLTVAPPASAGPPRARSHGMSTSASLPTLFVARTPSQRKRGETGIRETDPRNLALAKMGLSLGISTRSSHVEALVGGGGAPLASSKGSSDKSSSSKKDKRRSATMTEVALPALPTPSGMILVVEETAVSYESVVTSFV